MVATTEPQAVARARRLREVHPARRGLVWSWIAFTATFGFLRLLTYAIHVKVAGLGNVSAGGVHLHHYLYGILLVALVATFGLVEQGPRARLFMGIANGIGLALIIDEAALLIDLKDVYWDSQGRTSVIVALALIAIGLVGTLVTIRMSPHFDGDPDT